MELLFMKFFALGYKVLILIYQSYEDVNIVFQDLCKKIQRMVNINIPIVQLTICRI